MTTLRLFRSLIWLSIIIGLATCSDHRNPDIIPGSSATRLRVRSLTLELPNNLSKVSLFRYDNQGRLSSIMTYQSPDSTVAEIENSVYQYDGQNRLTQLQHGVILYPRTNQPNPVEQYNYSYNASGQLSGLAYATGFSLTFSYNGANKLARSSRQFLFSGIDQFGSESFTFTGNNLTALSAGRTLPVRGPSANSTSDVTYTHDDKVNPFYGAYIIPAPYPKGFVNMQNSTRLVETYFGGVENVLNLSQNNVLTQVANNSTTIGSSTSTSTVTTSYQYEYNAANLPTVRRTTTNNVLTETLRFDYESY